MNPHLLILRKDELEHYGSGNRIYFVVVNIDKAKEYPANFVCVLPAHKYSIVKPSTEFSRVFGSAGLDLAKKLLKDALEDEDDSEIRTEIEKRLRTLEDKKSSRKLVFRRGKHFTYLES